MAAIAWTDVVNGALASDAATIDAVDVSQQNAILAMVNTALDLTLFTDGLSGGGELSPKLFLARVYLALHYAKVGPNATLLTGERELDLGKTYGIPPIPPGEDPFWLLSGYGRAYLATIRATPLARMPWVM